MKVILGLLLVLFGCTAQAFDTSIIIGPKDWFPVSELSEESEEYKLSKLMGRVYSNNLRCSGWVFDGKYLTARHCVEDNNGQAEFCVEGSCVEVTYSYPASGVDLAYSEVKRKSPVKEPAYLLHYQEGKLMISPDCEVWDLSSKRVYHTCDSESGSSGGMLVKVVKEGKEEVHKPMAVHTGGIPSLQRNVAVKLSVLED